MNSEERDLISRFVARVGGGIGLPNGQGPSSLPPIDPEADRFIADNFQRFPEARYRITQLAVVQEAALSQAQARIRDLEFQLQQARGQLAQLQQQSGGQQSSGQSGGFFSGLFGRGQTASAPPPRGASLPPGWGPASGAAAPEMGRSYAPPPGYQPGMFARSGSGFLGSALSTAAGVAGGMMAAHALEGLFSGEHGHAAGMGDAGAGDGFSETTIINNYGDNNYSDPFAGPGQDASGFSPQDFGPQEAPVDNGGDFGSDGADRDDFF
ncbi:DUF2076 domain-containing protein [Bombella sp. TMW 2.2543]|uniref:DUF2076 domain-containing protein n=1 Tax=Bombella pluederhausensis TaxID=2967336 RepID=A0ABT3WI70_9PROT|nr:DUF2076 domain-containing protein [Bombella pluederhausensis]MCX5617323.1 DUF2076 domain-containing protein [Bombella pluederhausensis]